MQLEVCVVFYFRVHALRTIVVEIFVAETYVKSYRGKKFFLKHTCILWQAQQKICGILICGFGSYSSVFTPGPSAKYTSIHLYRASVYSKIHLNHQSALHFRLRPHPSPASLDFQVLHSPLFGRQTLFAHERSCQHFNDLRWEDIYQFYNMLYYGVRSLCVLHENVICEFLIEWRYWMVC